MNKIEMATAELGQAGHELRDDALDCVSGGVGLVGRSFGFILLFAPPLPPDPCRLLTDLQ